MLSKPKIPTLIVLILSVFFVKELFLAYLTPQSQAPDEIAHYGYAEHIAKTGHFPVLGETLFQEQNFDKTNTVALPDPDETPGAYINWIAQHPPLYYLLLQPIFWFAGGQNVFLIFFFLRLFSIIMGVVTLWISYMILHKLLPDREVLQAGIIGGMAFLPGFSFSSALVNNDNLINLLTAILFWLMISFCTNEQYIRRKYRGIRISTLWHFAIGIILGGLLLTKATALPLLAVVFLVEIIVAWQKHSKLKIVLFELLMTFAPAVLIAAPWLIRNWMHYHTLLPEIQSVVIGRPDLLMRFPDLTVRFPEIVAAGAAAAPSLLKFIFTQNFLWEYYKNFWGTFGLPFENLTLPQYVLIAAFTVLSAIGWIRGMSLKQKEKHSKIACRSAWILSLGLIVYFLFLSYKLFQIYLGRGFLGAMHGRYLYPVLLSFMYVFVLGLIRQVPEKFHAIAIYLLLILFVFNDFFTLFSVVIPEFY